MAGIVRSWKNTYWDVAKMLCGGVLDDALRAGVGEIVEGSSQLKNPAAEDTNEIDYVKSKIRPWGIGYLDKSPSGIVCVCPTWRQMKCHAVFVDGPNFRYDLEVGVNNVLRGCPLT